MIGHSLLKNVFPKQLADVIMQPGNTRELSIKNYIQGNIYRTVRDHTDNSTDKCDTCNTANHNLK